MSYYKIVTHPAEFNIEHGHVEERGVGTPEDAIKKMRKTVEWNMSGNDFIEDVSPTEFIYHRFYVRRNEENFARRYKAYNEPSALFQATWIDPMGVTPSVPFLVFEAQGNEDAQAKWERFCALRGLPASLFVVMWYGHVTQYNTGYYEDGEPYAQLVDITAV